MQKRKGKKQLDIDEIPLEELGKMNIGWLTKQQISALLRVDHK